MSQHLRAGIERLITWCDERRTAPDVTTLGMVQTELRRLLQLRDGGGQIPDFSELDDAAAAAVIKAAVREYVHPDHQFLATFALQIYFEVFKQGSNEIELISTVYHAGMTHARELMGMSYDDAVDLLNGPVKPPPASLGLQPR